MPVAPAATCTQVSSTATLHVHPVSVDTVSATTPASAETVVFAAETMYLHGAASCETPTWNPLTSMTPRRKAGCGFVSTRYAIVPLPCPDFADVSAIHVVDVVADHVQSRVVVIAISPVAPAADAVGMALSTVT